MLVTESVRPTAASELWGASVLGGEPGREAAAPAGAATVARDPSRVRAPWLLTTRDFAVIEETEWELCAHEDHELLWSTAGTVTVEANGQLWLVPPALAIWLPAGQAHRVRARPGSVVLASYIDIAALRVEPGEDPARWGAIAGVPMTGALRELLLANHVREMPEAHRARIQRVILDLIQPVRAVSVELPMPSDPELLAVARRILADPADTRTVEAWAAQLNISGRTLMRRFSRDTGMSLTQWRILARIRRAMIELADGAPVVAVAKSLGYSSPGAFIALFRQVTGHTPAAYFRSIGQRDERGPLGQRGVAHGLSELLAGPDAVTKAARLGAKSASPSA